MAGDSGHLQAPKRVLGPSGSPRPACPGFRSQTPRTVSPQVNNENVVKVGHRQVVNMIRQGGNHLVLKVVTVSRSLDPDDTARKKGGTTEGGRGSSQLAPLGKPPGPGAARGWPLTRAPSVHSAAPPPPKRAPTTALTLRSKSMTSELEELGKSRQSRPPQPTHSPGLPRMLGDPRV